MAAAVLPQEPWSEISPRSPSQELHILSAQLAHNIYGLRASSRDTKVEWAAEAAVHAGCEGFAKGGVTESRRLSRGGGSSTVLAPKKSRTGGRTKGVPSLERHQP